MRVEFGYPIMVTPLSQFVGSQAAINVIVGERYKEVTDQVIRYALGHFGEEAVTAMDQEVRARILDRPRAKEIMAQTREHPTMADMRRDLDAATVSEEELLLALAAEQGGHRGDARRGSGQALRHDASSAGEADGRAGAALRLQSHSRQQAGLLAQAGTYRRRAINSRSKLKGPCLGRPMPWRRAIAVRQVRRSNRRRAPPL